MAELQIKKIGKYEILAELGKGAMGVVYKAQDPFLGRLVAIKTMSSSLRDDANLLQRFYREAQAAGNLRHANIVTIYDLGEENGIPFIAMEFLEGQDLEEAIRKKAPWSILKKLNITSQICRGLHYAHDHGVIHRDVKPANIRILARGEVKILDFGIARVTGSNMTRTDLVMGTVNYMSPEQIQSPQSIDRRSDLFSVGVILYEMLAGQRPFTGESIPSTLFRIINEPAPPLSRSLPSCPAELETIMQKVLAKNQDQRFQSCEEFAMELDSIRETMRPQVISELLTTGQKNFEENDFHSARQHFVEVLELDSNHRLAKNLLRRLEEQQKKYFQDQQAQNLLREGIEHLQNNSLDEAMRCFESARQLDTQNTKISQLIFQTREKKTELDRRKEFETLLTEGKKQFSERNLEHAVQCLDRALQVLPDESRATGLRRLVLEEMNLREKHRRIGELVLEARGFLSRRQFADAERILDQCRTLDPGNLECRELRNLLETEKESAAQQRLLEEKIAFIDQAIIVGHYREASQTLAEAEKLAPADLRLTRLANLIQTEEEDEAKRREKAGLLQNVHSLMSERRFLQALEILNSAISRFPEDVELMRLALIARQENEKAEQERLLSAEFQQIQSLLKTGQCQDALRAAEELAKRYPGRSEIQKLRGRAAEECQAVERQIRRENVIRKAKQLVYGGQHQQAISELEAARQDYPGDPEIERFLRITLQEKGTIEKRQQLEAIFESARKSLSRNLFREVRHHLAKADEVDPENIETVRLRQQLEHQEAEEKRKESVGQITTEVREWLRGKKYDQASSLVSEGLQQYPDDYELETLLRLVQEEKKREERFLHLQGHLNQITNALKKQDAEAAVSLALDALREFPENQELETLYRQAEEQREKRQRIDQLTRELENIESLLQAGRFAEAISILYRFREAQPENADLINMHLERALQGQRTSQASMQGIASAPAEEAPVPQTSTAVPVAAYRPQTAAARRTGTAKKGMSAGFLAAAGVLLAAVVGIYFLFFAGAEKGGAIQVRTDMEEAVILVDGKEIGPIRGGKLSLPSLATGSHTLEARKEGYAPLKETLYVSSGAVTDWQVKMTPLPPTLKISVDQPSVYVRVDGLDFAVTDEAGKAEVTSIPAGKHSVVLFKEGFREIAKEVELSSGKAVEIKETMAAEIK